MMTVQELYESYAEKEFLVPSLSSTKVKLMGYIDKKLNPSVSYSGALLFEGPGLSWTIFTTTFATWRSNNYHYSSRLSVGDSVTWVMSPLIHSEAEAYALANYGPPKQPAATVAINKTPIFQDPEKKFYVSTSVVMKRSDDRYPHVCKRCGAAAYESAFQVDCSRGCFKYMS